MTGLFLSLFCLLSVGRCSVLTRNEVSHNSLHSDPDEPLILTDYIKRGDIEGARQAARVPPLLGETQSYSGYFTVDEQSGSNLFFWYFPAEDSSQGKDAPVVLWLQGGPGVSSLYGLFFENGPFSIISENNHTSLKSRPFSWTKHNHVIYIDNPDWVGFSFSKQKRIPNIDEVGADLYSALVQFFQIFPDLRQNDFFATGESYGGVYVPALGHVIHRNNPAAKIKINLKGLAIGDGGGDGYPCDDEEHSKYAEENGLESYNNYNLYNYLEMGYSLQDPNALLDSYLNQAEVKRHLHVGNTPYVTERFYDVPGDKKVAEHVEELLEHYSVTYYTGQLDFIVIYPCIEKFLYDLNWSGAPQYKTASRSRWIVGNELAGYFKTAGNLTSVLVRNAGHMVPLYQPKWANDLITRIVHNHFN